VNRNPRLMVMRLVLGVLLPLLVFLVLYLPVLLSLREALHALGTPGGILSALENPREAVTMILRPVLYSYAALLVCLIVYLGGSAISETSALRVLAGAVSPHVAITGAPKGRGEYRQLALYSLVFSIAYILVLFAFAFLGATVAGLLAALGPVDGTLLRTMLVLATSASFVMSLIYLYSVRLEGIAFLTLDGTNAPGAFISALRSLWRNPGSANAISLMLAGYGLLQPLMALGALGLLNVPDAGAVLTSVWCVIWVVLDIYLGLGIKATVLVAHRSASPHRSLTSIRIEDVVGILDDADDTLVDTPDVWGFYEGREGRETSEGDENGHEGTAR